MRLRSDRYFGLLVFCICVGVSSDVVAQTNAPRSLSVIRSQSEFDTLAVTYDQNTPYALPHLLFVIDRQDQNKIYYVNTKKYRFHKDFVNGTYLSLERGKEFFENNYLKENRRFILGSLAYQTPIKRWTFEYWEGTLIPPDQVKLTSDVINRSFFAAVAYKPNSLRQEDESRSIPGLQRVLQSDIAREQSYQALNVAKGIGRIHVITKLDDHVEIGFKRNTGTGRSADSSTTRRGDHYLAAFHSAVAHKSAGERLGRAQRLHQERDHPTEAIRRLVGDF